MDNNLFKGITKNDVGLLKSTSLIAEKEDLKLQREKIEQLSPYSKEINMSFSGYEEYEFIHSLGLKEAVVTRKSLIREIDFDLFITSKQKTNYELMLEGASPYLTDNENDCIAIHHIGQTFNSPFAELTVSEHSQFGNSKILHNTKAESWRNERSKVNDFQLERISYWKKRASKEITLIEKSKSKSVLIDKDYKQKSIIVKIKEPIERIFSACSIEDLKYISNLANGYILTKQVGGKTIEDFVLNLNKIEEKSISCPKCNSERYSYYGYQETLHEKKQRYKCKDCGNVFSMFRNTIISGCNFSFMKWIQFIDCLYNGYSLEKTANLCNISVQAAFENRMNRKKITIKNYERSKEIYERWSSGEIMQDIADSIGLSKQRVHQIINEFRKKGFAYTTEFEKRKQEKQTQQQWQDKHFAESLITFERNYKIFLEYENWNEDKESFYKIASQKYNLSVRTIKNRICETKRIIKLRKTFYVYEEYEHLTLRQLFELIYKRYNEILSSHPKAHKFECHEILAKEFGYTRHTIEILIYQMNKNVVDWENKEKIKIPKSQSLNRDISVFIDFMKWTKNRKDFFEYTKEKYGISAVTTRKILQMNYLADPKRFEITKMY